MSRSEKTTTTTTTTQPWHCHRIFYYALAARVYLAAWQTAAVDAPSSLSWHYHYPHQWLYHPNDALASLVANPTYTLSQVKERLVDWTWQLQQVQQDDNNDDDKSWWTCLVSQLVTFFVSSATSSGVAVVVVVVSFFLLVIDFDIARQLGALAQQQQQQQGVAHQQDEITKMLQEHMPVAIRPANQNGLPSRKTLAYLLPLAYFGNPAVILASHVYHCYSNIFLWLILTAVRQYQLQNNGQKRYIVGASVCLAAAAAICGNPSFGIIFAVAMVGTCEYTLLIYTCLQGVIMYVCSMGGPHVSVSSHWYDHHHHNNNNNVPPISLSVAWYTHMEFFTRFAPYLRLVLGYLPYIVVIPLAMRLHRYPLVLIAIYWMLLHTLCQPVSTLTDFTVGCLLFLLSPAQCARMKSVVTLFALAAIGVPVTLYVVLHPLWLKSGAGEANFIYFQCLAYQILVANVLLQFVSASLQHDKALRVTHSKYVRSMVVGSKDTFSTS